MHVRVPAHTLDTNVCSELHTAANVMLGNVGARMEKILGMRGETGSPNRKFLIRWKGYGPEHDQCEPRRNIHPDLIKEYLHANNLYDHEWPGERCPRSKNSYAMVQFQA